MNKKIEKMTRFNTVNGKGCCNALLYNLSLRLRAKGFNTVNGKGCCNLKAFGDSDSQYLRAFQYRKR